MKIITDTASLYTPTTGQPLGIDVLPLSVTVDNKTYQEFVEITSEEFLTKVKAGFIPSSSQPSVGHTIELFEKYKDEDVLVLSMADGLSGTYQSTLGARESVESNQNIHVINTRTLCGPHRYIVQRAVALRDQGCSIQEVIEQLQPSIENSMSYLIPSDFGFLKRGGRLTPVAARIAGLIKIVPVMQTVEQGRRIEKFTVKKTLKGGVKDVCADMKKNGVDESYQISVSHAGVLELGQAVLEQIKQEFKDTEICLYDLSPAFITQGGPGCVAIQYVKK